MKDGIVYANATRAFVLHFHEENSSKHPQNRSKGYQASNNSKWDSLSKKTYLIKAGKKGGGKAPVPKGNKTVLPVFALLFSENSSN